MSAFGDCDIDSGGRSGTLSKDGKDDMQIVIEIMGGKYRNPPQLPINHNKWTTEEELENEEIWESNYSEFKKITSEFNW